MTAGLGHDPEIFGIRLSGRDLDGLVRALEQPPSCQEALPLFTLNVAHITSLRRDAAFRRAYRAAWRVTVDGMPVFLLARAKGLKVAKVAGSDLVVALFRADLSGMRPFFVASTQETTQALRTRLAARGLAPEAMAFDVPPFGFERDEAYSRALAARVTAHNTTHLLMGVGAPKSEIWVVRWKRELGGCYALCVGAGLDFLAGTRRRAPVAMQKVGLEWAWRLGAEPRRLARRYVGDALAFAYIVTFGALDVNAEAERDSTQG